jgi:hypothetical protein
MKTIIKILSMASVPFMFSILLMSMFADQAIAIEKTSKITFDEPKHDFGKVKQGVALTFIFKFKNDGDERLVIQNVRPSCGCTGASIGDKKEFEKGEEGEIKVTFSTSGRVGAQIKTVVVQSNDPKTPSVVLSFTCEIVANNQELEEKK